MRVCAHRLAQQRRQVGEHGRLVDAAALGVQDLVVVDDGGAEVHRRAPAAQPAAQVADLQCEERGMSTQRDGYKHPTRGRGRSTRRGGGRSTLVLCASAAALSDVISGAMLETIAGYCRTRKAHVRSRTGCEGPQGLGAASGRTERPPIMTTISATTVSKYECGTMSP